MKPLAAATVAAPEQPPVQAMPRPIVSILSKRSTEDRVRLPSQVDMSGFAEAEANFVRLLQTENLDKRLSEDNDLVHTATSVKAAISQAIDAAYSPDQKAYPELVDDSPLRLHESAVNAAHLFLQRILYRINRLNLFWYDDLKNYSNDRSMFLSGLREHIEEPWQHWEMSQLPGPGDYQSLSPDEVKERLRAAYKADVDPPLSDDARYMQEDMSLEGYRHLLAVASVDGLVEASRQSRVCGGAANDVACMVFRVLMEEYGTGRFNKKHSTFFAQMMKELGLRRELEWYFDLVPWESLASMNHNFLLTERRRHYLKYCGGLTYFEVAGPSIYRTYLAAANRLRLSDNSSGYWALHITEDERHGRQMVEDVALPLVDRYPGDAWEVLLGYEQEKFQGARAGAALIKDLQVVDKHQHTPADDM